MLRISQLDVSIGSVAILRGVSLELPSGVMAGLIGRNGAGKTTLMRSVMGLLKPRAGRVEFDGADLGHIPAHRRAHAGIGYMPEDRRLIPELTVEENILAPAWAVGRHDGRERLRKIYAMIPELEPFAPRKALQLSGGQQKLAALGRALMCGTKLLLLDEPFEGVAPVLAQRIADVIAALKHEGLSVIVSESDLQHSTRMLDIVFRIERGEVTQMSSTQAI
jgi:branched-chain amino acid transport system ATP-binding protein